MAENQDTTQTGDRSGPPLKAGMRIPMLKPGSDDPNFMSAGHANMVTAVANAVLNIKIIRKTIDDGSDPHGEVKFSNENMVIELYDAPGGATDFFNTDQTYTANCPAGTSGSSVTVTVTAGTIGVASPKTVADANALALELATDRANNALICYVNGTQGVDDEVLDVLITGNGKVLIGGEFTKASGVLRPGLALLLPDLTTDPASYFLYPPGSSSSQSGSGTVIAYSSTKAFVFGWAGVFNYVGFESGGGNGITFSPGVCRINFDGSFDTTFLPTTGFGGAGVIFPTRNAAMHASNRVLACTFGSGAMQYNGNNVFGLIKINSDGSFNSTFNFSLVSGSISTGTPPTNKVKVDLKNNILLLGGFGQHTVAPPANLYKYNSSTISSRDFMWMNSSGTMQTFTDAGSGTNAGFQNGHGDGGTPGIFQIADMCYLFDPNPGLNQFNPTAFIFLSADVVYNSSTNKHIIKTDTAGNIDASFNSAPITFTPSNFANGLFLASIYTYDNGTHYYVCGKFTQVNGSNMCGIVRLNSSGVPDNTWVGISSISSGGYVNAMGVLPSGNIVIGGKFTSLNGLTRNNIALLDSFGNLQ